MHELIRQLEGLAGAARRMLVMQRLSQLAAAAVVALIGAGLVDFALRLPGGLRLAIGIGAMAVAAWWLWTRLNRALAFRPDVATIALRAERLYPQLKDHLASGVEFAAHREAYRDPQRTAAFADAVVAQAGQRVEGVALRRLLDRTLTWRWMLAAAAAAVVTGAIVAAAPGAAGLALQRWFAPLGGAEWPRRTAIESLVHDTVWPTDTPLKVEAAVHQGYYPGMRAWVNYRVVEGEGADRGWQAVLMSDQAERARNGKGGRFERLIDLSELLGPSAAKDTTRLELYMSAGDDRTAAQPVLLVARPAVRSVKVTLAPPDYAQGLVAPQTVALDEQAGSVATASALQASTVTLDIVFNKPLDLSPDMIPGLPPPRKGPGDDLAGPTRADRLTATFTLDATLQTPITLTDEHGLTSVSDRVYRIEAIEDKPPAAALVEPVADESVLATAVVEVEAAAQDDVGIERLALEVLAPVRDAATSPATVAANDVAAEVGRSPRLRLAHTLQLTPYALVPGDEVTLTAVAQDVFAMGELRHEPVRSTPRKLRIIDVPALVAQVRSELANLRQQVIRLESAQRELMEQDAAPALPGQQQLDRRLDTQQKTLQTLRDRLERNRLDEPTLQQTMDRARDLLDQARAAAQEAAGSLQQAANQPSPPQAKQQREEARTRQQDTRDALGELITLLDQGRDALTLQLQLRQMLTQQEQLVDDTRKMLPQTAGERPEDLAPEQGRQLEQLSDRQESLARQAEEMARQMQATADALQRQSESDQDQAAAQALREAAAIAQRQGLSPQMDKAAESAQENKLSEAGQQQLGAIDTMQQMMGAIGSQEQKRQEMLRRRLAELAELVRKLVEQQQVQLDRLVTMPADRPVAELDEGMSALRRNAISVEGDARKSEETAAVAEVLGKAIAEQAGAITALRAEERDDAERAERQSLAYLEEALQLTEEAKQQAEEQMTDQARAELEQAYRKLADEQEALRKRTAELTQAERLDRRQRADLVQLGHEEADLQIAAAELREQVEQTLVFVQMHRRIDEAAARVARQLRAGLTDETVLFEQDMITARLRAMADALQQPKQGDDDFRENDQQGGGGGGGGGGQPPELIPPVAELKLIRGTQEVIYQQTRNMDAQVRTNREDPGLKPRMLDLSAQQRELSDLGRRLIDKVKNPTGGDQ